jgi:hypothetical protein
LKGEGIKIGGNIIEGEVEFLLSTDLSVVFFLEGRRVFWEEKNKMSQS